jgi:hypothetical protein
MIFSKSFDKDNAALLMGIAMGLSGIANFLGQDVVPALKAWDRTEFGLLWFGFVPFDSTQKRILAGTMELMSSLLLLNGFRVFPCSLLAVMLGWASKLHFQLGNGIEKVLLTGAACAINVAILLDTMEAENPKKKIDNEKPKKN